MAFFDWDNTKFGLGVSEMDQEHQQIIAYMNKLHDQNEKHASKEELEKTVTALAQYTIKHFQDEEKYMASIGYPKIDTHKIIHKNLLDRFGKHVEVFKNGEGGVSKDFFEFLRMWLSAHIQGIDREYAAHSQSKLGGLKKAG